MNSVHHRAIEVLKISDPFEKCRAAQLLYDVCLATGVVPLNYQPSDYEIIDSPGRPAKPKLIHPRKLARRSLFTDEGRIVFMHAIAHIEFNAINLACDAVYRFFGMPEQYYLDWISVAADEARHFELVVGYLAQCGCQYGDYPAHDGLWDMAMKTQHDVGARMALVPRVLEARGLDVTPAMIEKLRGAGDDAAVNILTVIYNEEIRHVKLGSYWFKYLCKQRGLDADKAFFELLDKHFAGELRGPFNLDARQQAGFSQNELKMLLDTE